MSKRDKEKLRKVLKDPKGRRLEMVMKILKLKKG